MNITKENIDELNAIVKIKLGPEDYQERVDKKLKDYRKNARIPGFRPGKVPMSMVKKMVGQGTLVEEINQLLASSINEYIVENKLDVLGNPLPKIDEAEQIDWSGDEFEFSYELGLAPDFKLDLSSSFKFDQYQIEIDEKMVDDYVRDAAKRYGKMSNPETADADDLLYGTFVELNDEGEIVEGGITNQSTLILEAIADEKLRNRLVGVKAGDETKLTLGQMKTETEAARMIGKTAEEVKTIDAEFKFTVEKVNRLEPAELNEELFNKIYGEGAVKTEEEFREKIKTEVSGQFSTTSDQKLMRDIQDKLIEKAKMDLPDEFLKRWLMNMNEKPITKEQLESEYDQYALGLKWQLIENRIIKEQNLEVKHEDAVAHAIQLLKQQFGPMNQGMMQDSDLEEMAGRILSNQEESKKIYDQLYDVKLLELYKTTFKIKEKKISYDDFLKLVNK